MVGVLKSETTLDNGYKIWKYKLSELLILYTLLNQMRVVKNIRRKDDRMNSLYEIYLNIL